MLEQNYSAMVQDYDEYLKLEPSGPISDNVRQRKEKLEQELQRAGSH